MAWERKKTALVGAKWEDPATGKGRVVSMVGPAQYESVLGSGVYDLPYDFTPERVNSAQLNGWRVQKSDFHYALQTRNASQQQPPIGTMGYGGLKGKHWFTFRLEQVGYLHGPTRAMVDLGGPVTYTPNQLSSQVDPVAFGPEARTLGARFEWRNLWNTPGGGEVYLRWKASPRGLKEEIVVNQAAREWLAKNRIPTTPLKETYFGFRFAIDDSDLPKVFKKAVLQSKDGDFNDEDGDPFEFRDATDALLGLLPIDDVYVPGRGGRRTLTKRWYREGGQTWLVVAVKVSELGGLLPGDLVFDPTITQHEIEADADDCYGQFQSDGTKKSFYIDGYGSSGKQYLGPYLGGGTQYHGSGGYRFRTIDIPQGATIDSATLQLYRSGSFGSALQDDFTIYGDDQDDAPVWADNTANRPPGITKTTASVDWDVSGWSNNSYNTSPDIGPIIEEIVGRPNWAENNDLRLVVMDESGTDDRMWAVEDFAGGSGNYALLDVEYTASSGTTLTPGVVAITLSGPSASLSLGAVVLAPSVAAVALAAPSVAMGMGAQVVTPGVSVANLSTPSPSVSLGATTLVPGASTSSLTVPSVGVVPGAVTVSPASLAVSILAPSVAVGIGAHVVTPAVCAVPLVPPSLSLAMGGVAVQPAVVTCPLSAPTISLSAGSTVVVPSVASTALQVPSAAVLPGATSLQVSFTSLSLDVPSVSVVTGAAPITLTPLPVAVVVIPSSLSVGLGAIVVSPTSTPLFLGTPSATVLLGGAVGPSPTVLSMAVPSVSVSAGAVVLVPQSVSSQVGVPAATIVQQTVLSPSSVPFTFLLPPLAVGQGARVVTPDPASLSVLVPTPLLVGSFGVLGKVVIRSSEQLSAPTQYQETLTFAQPTSETLTS